MRLFVAANLTGTIKEALAEVQRALRSKGGGVSWVKPENLHITLKFLGEVEERMLKAVRGVIASSVAAVGPVLLSFADLGTFPHLRSPRVIWVGVREGAEGLSLLQANLEQGFKGIGFPRENRSFTAHLTLGRVRSPKGLQPLVEEVKAWQRDALGEMVLKQVDLMRSQLHPGGSIYTILESFPLQTPP
ncbi:MAG: RNA 2',3'-cyclic phosphodiesterase [candidate division NC10 bacterium]|nr:RNA 2',3'-cyclic phosphodiesterase [candidate division NC10 bacterium]